MVSIHYYRLLSINTIYYGLKHIIIAYYRLILINLDYYRPRCVSLNHSLRGTVMGRFENRFEGFDK